MTMMMMIDEDNSNRGHGSELSDHPRRPVISSQDQHHGTQSAERRRLDQPNAVCSTASDVVIQDPRATKVAQAAASVQDPRADEDMPAPVLLSSVLIPKMIAQRQPSISGSRGLKAVLCREVSSNKRPLMKAHRLPMQPSKKQLLSHNNQNEYQRPIIIK